MATRVPLILKRPFRGLGLGFGRLPSGWVAPGMKVSLRVRLESRAGEGAQGRPRLEVGRRVREVLWVKVNPRGRQGPSVLIGLCSVLESRRDLVSAVQRTRMMRANCCAKNGARV